MKEIILHNVKKSFKGVEVLDIPQLRIKEGEIVSFLGKNGSGKSTTIKIISGLLYQDEGEVNVFEIKNTEKSIRDQCKLVLESGKGYYDYLTAEDNMKYFLGLNKINYNNIQEQRDYYIDMLDFREHMNKKVSELSQGNRQKLSIIVSLLTNPSVLCLDEPTNGLDIITSNFLMSCLKRISNEKNTTILMTTHDLLFIKNIDARCIVLNQGKIITDTRASQLLSSDFEEKYLIDMPIVKLSKVEALKLTNFRYTFKETEATIIVYNEKDKEKIIKNVEITGLRQEHIGVEDIYYKVMNDGK